MDKWFLNGILFNSICLMSAYYHWEIDRDFSSELVFVSFAPILLCFLVSLLSKSNTPNWLSILKYSAISYGISGIASVYLAEGLLKIVFFILVFTILKAVLLVNTVEYNKKYLSSSKLMVALEKGLILVFVGWFLLFIINDATIHRLDDIFMLINVIGSQAVFIIVQTVNLVYLILQSEKKKTKLLLVKLI